MNEVFFKHERFGILLLLVWIASHTGGLCWKILSLLEDNGTRCWDPHLTDEPCS